MKKSIEISEKRLYEIIECAGETLNGSLHIIDQSDSYPVDEREGKYRVYHSDGYCFDVQKEYVCEPNKIKNYCKGDVEKDGFTYSFYAEWEGFDNSLTLKAAIELMAKNVHFKVS